MLDLSNVREMSFGKDCFGKYEGELEICNYAKLEKIVMKNLSMQRLSSLKIGDNERLKTIEIEDGERWQENEKWYQNGALYYVKSVNIESM